MEISRLRIDDIIIKVAGIDLLETTLANRYSPCNLYRAEVKHVTHQLLVCQSQVLNQDTAQSTNTSPTTSMVSQFYIFISICVTFIVRRYAV